MQLAPSCSFPGTEAGKTRQRGAGHLSLSPAFCPESFGNLRELTPAGGARRLRCAGEPETHTTGGVLTAALGRCKWRSRQGRHSLQDRAGGSQSGAHSRSRPCM